jgi:5-methylcytosine-specific restriction endonuclease McrA
VQQKVWAADGFQCVYCGAKMGETLLTVDHFVPLELGGANENVFQNGKKVVIS